MSDVAQRLRKMQNEKLFDFFLSGRKLPVRAQLSNCGFSRHWFIRGKNMSAEKRKQWAYIIHFY